MSSHSRSGAKATHSETFGSFREGGKKALADLGVSYVIAHFGRYAGADEFRRFAERFIKEIATEFVDA